MKNTTVIAVCGEGGVGKTTTAALMVKALVEHKNFALLAIGRPEGEGCYCEVNHLLKDIIESLSENFDVIIIDGEPASNRSTGVSCRGPFAPCFRHIRDYDFKGNPCLDFPGESPVSSVIHNMIDRMGI